MFMKYLFSFLCLLSFNTFAEFQIGVGTHMNNYKRLSSDYTTVIKNYGFNSVRDGFSWNSVSNSDGSLAISDTTINADLLFSNANNGSAGLGQLFVLGYGSNLYTNGDYPQTKDEVDKFVEYVAWVANRYKGQIKYYEVWNEWLLGTGIGSTANKPDDAIFLYLVQQSYNTIKAIDPDAVVLTGSINPLHSNEVEWLQGLISQGLLNYVDGISIHPYAYNEPVAVRDPEGSFAALDSFEAGLTTLAGKAVPLYITEMGYPTGSGFTGGVTTAEAGQDVAKYTLLAASRSYIKGLWWYDLIDDGTSTTDKEDNFGLFYASEQPKESAQILRVLLPLIKDRTITVTSDDSGNYTASAEGVGQLSWVRDQDYTVDQWLTKLGSASN